MKRVYFVDTTLRDGEQAPGVAFTVKEKVQIAWMLDWLGVDQIEAGIPAMGPAEAEAIEKINGLNLKATVSAWNRITISDIKASLACGVKTIHVAAPVSDIQISLKLRKSRIWVIENTKRAINYALEQGCRVTVGAEDASRADIRFLVNFAGHVRREGAGRLRYADTLGVLEPFKTRQIISCLVQYTGMDIEFHGHNDFGMATANTLAAFKGGARYLSTTLNGLGERAGNSSFEEAVRALEGFEHLDLKFNPELLSQICTYVSRTSGREAGNTAVSNCV